MSAGPDLGAVFDEHVASEFETKDIDATMRTMVDEPYVWHVPALTGASGGEAVRRFFTPPILRRTPAGAVPPPRFPSGPAHSGLVAVRLGLTPPPVVARLVPAGAPPRGK